jgi:hypothetical protein
MQFLDSTLRSGQSLAGPWPGEAPYGAFLYLELLFVIEPGANVGWAH